MIASHLHGLRYTFLLGTLWTLFSSFYMPLSAQSLDSEELKNSTKNLDSIYYELFKKNRTLNLTTAKYYAFKTYQSSVNLNHSDYIVKACNALGYTYEMLNQFDSARFYYHKGLGLATKKGIIDRLIFLSNNLGLLFEKSDMYDSALFYYSLSLSKAKESGSYLDQCLARHNMGIVYHTLENFDKAILNLEEDIRIREHHNITEGIDKSLINLAIVYCDTDQLGKCEECIKKVKLINGSNFDDYTASNYYFVLGLLSLKKGLQEQAYDNFQMAINYGRTSNNWRKTASAFYYLSLYEENIETSLWMLSQSKNVATKNSYKGLLRDIFFQLSKKYDSKGMYDSALFYQRKYNILKDSIFNKTIANNIKELELASQRKESELIIDQKEEQIAQSQLISLLISIISLLLITIVSLVIRSLMAGKRHKKTLENAVLKKTLELEDMNKELSRSHLEYNYLVYRTSRDIRAPLSTLMGLINISNSDRNEDDWKRHVDRVKHELDIKLDQLTELYEIRDQQVSFQEITIDSLVTDIYAAFAKESKFPIASVIIDKEVPRQITTDRSLLANLILCTARYFTQGLHELVAIDFDYHDKNLTITIAGEPVPGKSIEQDNLFDLFLAQIAAWKLKGRLTLSETDKGLGCHIVIPQYYSIEQTLELDFSHSATA